MTQGSRLLAGVSFSFRCCCFPATASLRAAWTHPRRCVQVSFLGEPLAVRTDERHSHEHAYLYFFFLPCPRPPTPLLLLSPNRRDRGRNKKGGAQHLSCITFSQFRCTSALLTPPPSPSSMCDLCPRKDGVHRHACPLYSSSVLSLTHAQKKKNRPASPQLLPTLALLLSSHARQPHRPLRCRVSSVDRTMEHVASALSALKPTLEKHDLGSWTPADVARLCAMLREYGKLERRKKCGTCCHNDAAIPPASLSSSSNAQPSLSRESDDSEIESDTDAEAFAGAISEVDQCLSLVRDFLKKRIPFGVAAEPTVPAGKAERQAPQSSTTGTAPKKRARSPNGETPSSSLMSNTIHSYAAAISTPVYAVDAFLYSEDDIEKLVEEKQLTREYCCRCGSTDLGLVEFITHSFSQDQLVYLSCFLLPHLLDVVVTSDEASSPLTITDVGSRLGIVLWACAFALQRGLLAPERTSAADASAGDAAPEVQLVGIELDEALVKISENVVRRFFAPRRRHAPKLVSAPQLAAAGGRSAELPDVSSRIQLLQSNCFEGAAASLLSDSSLVVMHNVFEYFCSTAVEHARCWLKLRRLVHRSGQFLVCSPALEVTFGTFTEEVWSQACELEFGKKAGVSSAPLAWLASYVEPFDIAGVASDFLAMRVPSFDYCHDGCNEDKPDGDHHHRRSRDHCHHHSDDEHEGDGEESSEMEEQIRHIFVYRVK
ncbi:hypothetical protein, conserved [Leishmania tarentolae]|uniref:Uncharacterized protein n=1 Tax=Leishmania tarentolae TaxID=5689 RepID=A0A640KEV0_LEITA|nr:hypothetical protein, conserved [Leishmania tarentolae]